MNPNDVMVIVLKDIILCLLGFRYRATLEFKSSGRAVSNNLINDRTSTFRGGCLERGGYFFHWGGGGGGAIVT